MIGVDFQKAVVALIGWRAMHREGLNATLGACFVFRNRAQKRGEDGDIYTCAVEYAFDRDISLWAGNAVLDHFPDTREPQFIALLQRMDDLFDGTLVDNLTNGALSFRIAPTPNAEVCANIGPVLFYK